MNLFGQETSSSRVEFIWYMLMFFNVIDMDIDTKSVTLFSQSTRFLDCVSQNEKNIYTLLAIFVYSHRE